jgi:hypothetical protein
MARGFAIAGQREKSKEDYRQFLELWKDADPEIPILKQAETEYSRLQ